MRKIMNLFNRSKCQNPLERFSVTMLSEMINDDKNLLISPCRLMSLLSFLYGYSSEESKRRIEMLLGIDFKNTEQVHNSMSQSVILPTENYESWVRDDEKQLVKATICSSLWIDPSVTVSEGVNKTLREWIIEKKIFSFSSTDLQKEIKDHVAKYTNGLIKNLSLSIDSETKGMLMDCLYFQGKWRMTFDTEDTKPDTFIGIKKQRTIPFMRVRLMFGEYYTCQTFCAIKLSYRCYCEDRSYSMRIYLPKEDKTCSDILYTLQKRKDSIEYKTKPVILYLPKFSLKSTVSFSDLLSINGIGKIQLPLSENNQSLVIDKIIQQGAIKVTEKGTEAGISTYTVMYLGLPRRIKYYEMKINRPFVFEIVEDHSGARLFAGVVNQL